MIKERLQKLRAQLAENEIEGIIISQPENRFYLSGFLGSAGYLVITAQKLIIIVDFRYVEQAKRQAPDYEVFQLLGPLERWFSSLAGGLGVKRLGFESGDITYALYHQLTDIIVKNEISLQLIPTENVVESLRAVKEAEEIALITQAVEISDRAIAHVEHTLQPGMTELELAWEIEKYMRENGSETVPFELIVAAGPNSTLPHAHPSIHPIQPGEPIVIDIGAKYGSYTSDLTRTLCLGQSSDTFHKVYDAVLAAQLSAIALIKAGMTGDTADSIARSIINEAGYGDNFGHGLGHGIGLATHELPRLGVRSTDKLADGMVFSIEPGIYLPGWGGVRIEDIVQMANGKVVPISKAAKIA